MSAYFVLYNAASVWYYMQTDTRRFLLHIFSVIHHVQVLPCTTNAEDTQTTIVLYTFPMFYQYSCLMLHFVP